MILKNRRMDNARSKRILIVNPFGIGDVVFSMIVAQTIRRSLPDARIGFLCNERTYELVRMNTSIDRTYLFNRGELRRLWPRRPLFFLKKLKALCKMIQEERYDAVLDLSLGRDFSFYAMLIGIRQRIGFDFKKRGVFLTHKRKISGYTGRNVAELQLDLLEFLGLERPQMQSRLPLWVSEEAKKAADDFLKKQGISGNQPFMAVAPGGGKSWGPNASFKQWAPGRFAEVANTLAQKGFKTVLLGDKAEIPLLEELSRQLLERPACATDQPFDKLAGILLRSEFLLCNDGGLLHLASALGVKTVAIFGPVDEKVYGPYGDQTPHAEVVEPVPCRPCYQGFHFPPCPYQKRCLEELPAERALKAIQVVLNKGRI